MSRGHLLLAVLFFFSLPAFAQQQFLVSQKDSHAPSVPDFRTPPAATPDEPWRILPKADSDEDAEIVMKPQVDTDGLLVASGGPRIADNTCFAIRSYVVARDSKDSDSVHLVRYTTCVPAGKYRLKTTEAHVVLVR